MTGIRWPVVLLGALLSRATGAQESDVFCGSFPGRGEYELALHRFHQERIGALGVPLAAGGSVNQVADLAVIEADSRLLLPVNPFDLQDRAIAFEPLAPQGYRVLPVDSVLDPGSGRELSLGTYGSEAVDLPFSFPFYGVGRSRVYVNANGSLTFNDGDRSWRTGGSQFLSSLPRIAVYYGPLDPAAGGKVFLDVQGDRMVATWSEIPERENATRSTFQVVLEPSGRILMRFGRVDAPSGLVGVAFPAAFSGVDLVDVSAGGAGSGALFEEFRREQLVDRTAAVRRFYEAFPDEFDFVILWTTFDSDMGGALAFETTVRNTVRGIGVSLFNSTASWGSRGTLQSVVMMGDLANYPAAPEERFQRSDRTTLAVVAHEVGHRWLAFIDFINGEARSEALLGYAKVHWSFFHDSNASFMYGNALAEESDDRFRTIETWARYSRLDLYLMGLATPAEVAPIVLIEDASGRDSRGRALTAESLPERGVSFQGTRREIPVDDVILAEGPREPSSEQSQKTFRQAWVLLHHAGAPATAEQIAKLDSIRVAFERYFQDQTLGRAVITTSLAN